MAADQNASSLLSFNVAPIAQRQPAASENRSNRQNDKTWVVCGSPWVKPDVSWAQPDSAWHFKIANRPAGPSDSAKEGAQAKYPEKPAPPISAAQWPGHRRTATIANRMADVLILSNPKAGRGRSAQIATRLATTLRAAGYDTHRDIDADRPLPEAVITIGGDGTLRYAADKLFAAYGQFPPMLVIPGGTANLMDRHLQLRWDQTQLEQQVLAAIQERKLQYVDAATANGELFLLIAGVGFDAAIVAALDRMRTGPITVWSYVRPALEAIWTSKFLPLSVSVDGKPVFGPAAGMVFVGNVKEYGTGFPVLPRAISNDGLLDVCVLPCSSHEDLLRLALYTVTGDHPTLEGAKYLRGTRVRVTAKSPVPMQLDGDSAGQTPVEIEMLPMKVPFIVRGGV